MSGELTHREKAIREIKNSPPVFVIGSQRSGTSFLYRLIQGYLKIGFGRDNGNFVRLKKMLPYYGDLQEEKNIRKLMKDILAIPEFEKRFRGLKIDIDDFIENLEKRDYSEVVRRFYAEWAYFKGQLRWGGKTPDYTFHVNELLELFSDAKFVHIIRDGRDVALSLYNLNWGPKNAFVAAGYWMKRVKSARRFGENLSNDNYMEMRYESLLQQPAEEFERLVRFIDYRDNPDGVIEKFNAEIEGKIKPGNYFKWKTKMSPKEIRVFESVAGELLDDLRYEVINRDVLGNKNSSLRKTYYELDNARRKLLRGEGFKGIYEKLYRFVYDNTVKIRHLFN